MKRIKIGIIGCAGYGRNSIAYFAAYPELFELTAFLDVKKEHAENAAKKYGAKAFTSIDDFLAFLNMDAVSINTPVLLHYEHCRLSLNAGKHVMVTKPVTALIHESQDLLKLAIKKKRLIMVSHFSRYKAAMIKLKELIRENKLGKICNFVATSCSSAGLTLKKGDWRAIEGKNPGGPLLQCGIHTLDSLISVFGTVKKVSAMAQTKITDMPVIDNISLTMEFDSGVTGVMQSNYTTAYMHTLDILGTNGSFHCREHITGLGQTQIYFQERAQGPHEPWQMLRLPDVSGPQLYEAAGPLIEEFARQINAGSFDYSNMTESIHALKVVHAAAESAEKEKTITIKK